MSSYPRSLSGFFALGIMPSKSIRVANGGGSLLFEECVHVCVHVRVHTHTHTHTSFCVYSSTHGHLACFQVLAVANKVATNTGVWLGLPDSDFHLPPIHILAWNCWMIESADFSFEEPLFSFPQWQHHWSFPPRVHRVPSCGHRPSTCYLGFSLCSKIL